MDWVFEGDRWMISVCISVADQQFLLPHPKSLPKEPRLA